MPDMPDWQRYLSEDDRTTIERGRWARRVGFGVRPAVILIDVQNYMVGRGGQPRPRRLPLQLRHRLGGGASRPGASSMRSPRGGARR